ncbi:putative transferase [Helianthus annuus]|uniref:Putative polyprenyl synthetase n=1 Tax=Helianthus annuus TaxID=4232 RepID=A0A251T9G4_HELAN|nr:putative transferase [Helianthus annuus]KAJ0688759.1 putative transferase [Helianthus annuus]KAJ0874459.1 putative transferase [Helianthus annuus]
MPYVSSCSNRRIMQYKSSYYSFYLPNDYLDTFGDHNTVGKIGTDIEERKCSWLVAKALELASEEQKQILYENYGKKDQACVAKVKELYHTLNLQGVYEEYEKKTHEEFMNLIESHPSNVVQAVLKTFMGKIYKRQK